VGISVSSSNPSPAPRALAPTLIAFAIAGFAHAPGTIAFPSAQTSMNTSNPFAINAGAVTSFGGLFSP
jgi:hypothetical protein